MIFLYNLCKTTNSHGQSEIFYDNMAGQHEPYWAPYNTCSLTQGDHQYQGTSVFAFDEVSNLTVDGLPKVFLALRRVIRLLCGLQVWTFGLSTQSTLEHVTPAIQKDPSWRVTSGSLERHTAFYEFPLGVEAGRRL